MAITRECEKCNAPMPIVERADKVEIPHDCPHCGEKTHKRDDGGPREKTVVTGHVTSDGKKKEFVTVDASKGGLKIFYLGRPIPANAEVTVDLDSMSIHGRKALVAWTHKAASTYSHSGLKFI